VRFGPKFLGPRTTPFVARLSVPVPSVSSQISSRPFFPPPQRYAYLFRRAEICWELPPGHPLVALAWALRHSPGHRPDGLLGFPAGCPRRIRNLAAAVLAFTFNPSSPRTYTIVCSPQQKRRTSASSPSPTSPAASWAGASASLGGSRSPPAPHLTRSNRAACTSNRRCLACCPLPPSRPANLLFGGGPGTCRASPRPFYLSPDENRFSSFPPLPVRDTSSESR